MRIDQSLRRANTGVRAMFGDQEGMTLIELLVVCVIIGIAFVGLASIFPLGTRNLSESKMRTVATDLAQEKMEELLGPDAAVADLLHGTHTDSGNPIKTSFNRYWTVADDTPVTDIKKIEVRVTYPHGGGTRDATLVTFLRS